MFEYIKELKTITIQKERLLSINIIYIIYVHGFFFTHSCSVDPYLFENFNTVDGDFLTAKFRAFKFPESTYVQFKGTVNVCLDKCRGVSILTLHSVNCVYIVLQYNYNFMYIIILYDACCFNEHCSRRMTMTI